MFEPNISGSVITEMRNELSFNKGEFVELISTSRNTMKKWESEGLKSFSTAAEKNLLNLYILYTSENGVEILKDTLSTCQKQDINKTIGVSLVSKFFGTMYTLKQEQRLAILFHIFGYLSNLLRDIDHDENNLSWWLSSSLASTLVGGSAGNFAGILAQAFSSSDKNKQEIIQDLKKKEGEDNEGENSLKD